MLKEKLMAGVSVLLISCWIFFTYFGALRKSKFFNIVKRRHNFLTLRSHFIYCWVQIFFFFWEHILFILLQVFANELGPEKSFDIYIAFFSAYIFSKSFHTYIRANNCKNQNNLRLISAMKPVLNLVFLIDAVKNYPEFMGYEGNSFPEQPTPRLPQILPRKQSFLMKKDRRCTNTTALLRMDAILTFRPQPFLPWLEEGETLDRGLFIVPDESSSEADNLNFKHDSFLPWLGEDETMSDFFCINSPDPPPDDPIMEDDKVIKDIIGLTRRYTKNELVPIEI